MFHDERLIIHSDFHIFYEEMFYFIMNGITQMHLDVRISEFDVLDCWFALPTPE